MTPHQFLAKLCALVPPPHVNLVKYSGVFANRHRMRPLIVPTPEPAAASTPVQLSLFDIAGPPLPITGDAAPTPRAGMQPRSWSWLLARVFAIDIAACSRPGCHGRLKIVDVVIDPEHIALLLHGARAPPAPPPPGQLSFPSLPPA